jgi:hypothetical protein
MNKHRVNNRADYDRLSSDTTGMHVEDSTDAEALTVCYKLHGTVRRGCGARQPITRLVRSGANRFGRAGTGQKG